MNLVLVFQLFTKKVKLKKKHYFLFRDLHLHSFLNIIYFFLSVLLLIFI